MRIASTFLALLLVNVLHVARGSWLDGNAGVDRPGGDMEDMPVFLESAQDCGRLCWNNSRCAAWSFGAAGCRGTVFSSCSLKARVTKQSYNPCTVDPW